MGDFSANDRRLIREAVREIMNEPRNARSRPGTDTSFADQDYLAPEVYVAKPQSAGGIPALSGDTPGSALCDIYRVYDGDLAAVSGFAVKVYNLSPAVITQDYFTVKRDKYGTWFAATPSGSQAGQVASILFGEVDGTTASTADFDVTDLVVMAPAGAPLPSATLSGVRNFMQFPAADDDEILVFRYGDSAVYYGIPHPSRTDCL